MLIEKTNVDANNENKYHDTNVLILLVIRR